MQEKQLLSKFLEEVSVDSLQIAFGANAVYRALTEYSCCAKIVIWDKCPARRAGGRICNSIADVTKLFQRNEPSESLLDWITEHYKEYGCDELVLVSNSTDEGSQFSRGFGGICAFLRYPLVLENDEGEGDEDDDDWDVSDSDVPDPDKSSSSKNDKVQSSSSSKKDEVQYSSSKPKFDYNDVYCEKDWESDDEKDWKSDDEKDWKSDDDNSKHVGKWN